MRRDAVELLNDIGRFLSINIGTILTFTSGIVLAYFGLRTKQSGDQVEAAKVAVGVREVLVKERQVDYDREAKMQERFDAFMARLEREREEARNENAELRSTVRALTDKVEALKGRVDQLIRFIRAQGAEPPSPLDP